MKLLIFFVLICTLLGATQKYDNYQKTVETLLQLNIKNIESFDLVLFENENNVSLKFCMGKSICVFKMNTLVDKETTIKGFSKYGKVKLYKPYKMSLY